MEEALADGLELGCVGGRRAKRKFKAESQPFGLSERVDGATIDGDSGTIWNLECGSCLQALVPPSVCCIPWAHDMWSF